jgi:hypothetical protein
MRRPETEREGGEEKERAGSQKEERENAQGKEKNRSSHGESEGGRAAGSGKRTVRRKKASMEKLTAQVGALEPGRAGAGRVREPTAASVAGSHGNFR